MEKLFQELFDQVETAESAPQLRRDGYLHMAEGYRLLAEAAEQESKVVAGIKALGKKLLGKKGPLQ